MGQRSSTNQSIKRLPDSMRLWLQVKQQLSLSDEHVKMLLELKFSPKSLKNILTGWKSQGLDIGLIQWIEKRYLEKMGKLPPTSALAIETQLVQA